MKAMVLAAGLGTRLRPLTDTRPKALVEIGGRTLLEITLTRLQAFGVDEVIINVHHLADPITEYLAANRNFGMRVEVSREEALLDTGGGLKKAGWFFLEDARRRDEPFLLHNVDVISTIDLGRLVETHKSGQALTTLAVQRRDASRQLLFDDRLQLSGRRAGRDKDPEIVRPSTNLEALAFTGIHVISPRFLTLMTEQGVFSIIDVYLRLAGKGERIQGHRLDDSYWRDLGKPEQLQQAEQDYQQRLFT
jgi:NDP-sugar pyrophosphorylase family protein